jgi:hypothetical protein
VKLVCASLSLMSQALTVVIQGDDGAFRQMKYTWHTKEAAPLPSDWLTSLRAERAYQQGVEDAGHSRF